MTDFDLNLSTRPFRPYRLLNLGLICAVILLTVVSLVQIYGFVRYSRMTRAIRDNERDALVEVEALRKNTAELEARLDRPESAAKLKEIGFLNGLIARKDLSWTRLFATLETIVPESVHLVSLTPDVAPSGDVVVLHIEVRGRTITDVSRFIEALERSSEFEKVVVSVEEKNADTTGTDVTVTLTSNYYPQRATQ